MGGAELLPGPGGAAGAGRWALDDDRDLDPLLDLVLLGRTAVIVDAVGHGVAGQAHRFRHADLLAVALPFLVILNHAALEAEQVCRLFLRKAQAFAPPLEIGRFHDHLRALPEAGILPKIMRTECAFSCNLSRGALIKAHRVRVKGSAPGAMNALRGEMPK